MQSQTKRLIAILDKGGVLTTMRIFSLHIASPTRRISDIRATGYKVDTTFVKKNGKRYAEWRKGK